MRMHRLINLLDLLRAGSGPHRAADLAGHLGISVRSLYRDIDTLRGLGVTVDGAAGLGYTLIDDHALPPQSFSTDEVEALVLGLREVQETGDAPLCAAAASALSKLRSRLGADQRTLFDHAILSARKFLPRPDISIDTQALRRAARDERKVALDYSDKDGKRTRRVVWPLGIVSFDAAFVLLAYCELRADTRAFRLDRMQQVQVLKDSFRPQRVPLLRAYYAQIRQETVAQSCAPAPCPDPLS